MSKRIAEALVECGYANKVASYNDSVIWKGEPGTYRSERVDPFADTLEGRRQLSALTDLIINRESAQIDRLALLLLEGHDADSYATQCEFARSYFEQLEAQSD